MLIGLSTYTYPWAFGVPGYSPSQPMTGLDLLREATRLGVDAVQFGDNYPLHVLSAAEWQKLQREATERNLQIQVGTRGLTPENLKRYIRLAWEARSPFLRMVIDEGDFQPSVDEVIAIIKEKLPALEKAGVLLAIENHDRFKADDFAKISMAVGSAHVGFCLDTTNSFGAGETVDKVLMLAVFNSATIVNLHIKDFRIKRVSHKMGFLIEGCEPGTGMFDLLDSLELLTGRSVRKQDSEFLADIKQKLPKKYRQKLPLTLTLEQWPPLLNSLEETIATEARWAETGINWIRHTIKKLS